MFGSFAREELLGTAEQSEAGHLWSAGSPGCCRVTGLGMQRTPSTRPLFCDAGGPVRAAGTDFLLDLGGAWDTHTSVH